MDITNAVLNPFHNNTTDKIKATLEITSALQPEDSVSLITKYLTDLMYCYTLIKRNVNSEYSIELYHVSNGKDYLLYKKVLGAQPTSISVIHQSNNIILSYTLSGNNSEVTLNYQNFIGGQFGYWKSNDSIQTKVTISEPKMLNIQTNYVDGDTSYIGKNKDGEFVIYREDKLNGVPTSLFFYIDKAEEDYYTIQFEVEGGPLNYSVKTSKTTITSDYVLKTYEKESSVQYVLYPKNKSLLNSIQFWLEDSGESVLKNFQITKGMDLQSYIPTEGTSSSTSSSSIKFPIKNVVDDDSGTIYLRTYISDTYNSEDIGVIKSGDFELVYKGFKSLILSYKGIQKLSVILTEPLKDKLDIIWSWKDDIHKIAVNTNLIWNEEIASIDGKLDIIELLPDQNYSIELNRLLITEESLVYSSINELEIEDILIDITEKTLDIHFLDNLIYKQNNFIEGTLAPTDYSPILVSDSAGQLSRDYFFDDDTGDYTPYNKEYFTYEGTDYLSLSYSNIDLNFRTTVETEDGELIGDPLIIKDNLVYLNLEKTKRESLFGETLIVTYQVDRSFNVEFNTDTAVDSYKINFAKSPEEELSVVQEGNRFSNVKLAKEIEMNPIINPQHKGFLYITQNNQEAYGFRINVSSDMVHADGIDSADVIVETIDKEGNEILNPYLDVYLMNEEGLTGEELGQILPVVSLETLKERKMAGRVYLKYYSPHIQKEVGRAMTKIFIVAYDRKKKIGIQYPLYLKPTDKPVIKRNILPSVSSLVVFEYLARYYQSQDIPEEITKILDSDGNSQITREDLNSFIENQFDNTKMMNDSYKLLQLEGEE